jgi:hypothetical protein
MLSTLPKLADKTFIIGFFLPTLLFAVAGLGLFSDFSIVREFLDDASKSEIAGRLVFLLLGLWSLSILMMVANHHLYQVLEGYRWPVCKFGTRREFGRFKASYDPFKELSNDWLAAKQAIPPRPYPTNLQREYDRLRKFLVTDFPEDPELLLPTRFGNAIRAFETYSQKVYGADSIPLWLHLSSVIPKEFGASLDDARAEVNFLVNTCYFAGTICLAAFVRVLVHGAVAKPPFLDLKTFAFILISAGAACICRMSYIFSLQRVYAWGALVKAAFDCFLPALAGRLGYALPKSAADQKDFWIDVSQRAIFHFPLAREWPQIAPPSEAGKSAGSNELGKAKVNDKGDKDDKNDDDDKDDSPT